MVSPNDYFLFGHESDIDSGVRMAVRVSVTLTPSDVCRVWMRYTKQRTAHMKSMLLPLLKYYNSVLCSREASEKGT
jgi:hypothetical protein